MVNDMTEEKQGLRLPTRQPPQTVHRQGNKRGLISFLHLAQLVATIIMTATRRCSLCSPGAQENKTFKIQTLVKTNREIMVLVQSIMLLGKKIIGVYMVSFR